MEQNRKNCNGVECFFGAEQLDDMLSQCHILVCLLPLTNETQGIFCQSLFNKLPGNACLINAGRGKLQVESDILLSLENNQLGGAALDVFETEPLQQDSALWSHPKVSITPQRCKHDAVCIQHCFETNPDEIRWGDAGFLADIASDLQHITDRVF